MILSKKAFFNPEVKSKNLITSFTGIALLLINLVVSVLLAMGKILPEQATPLNEALGAIVASVGQIVGYVSSIILMFRATDPQ